MKLILLKCPSSIILLSDYIRQPQVCRRNRLCPFPANTQRVWCGSGVSRYSEHSIRTCDFHREDVLELLALGLSFAFVVFVGPTLYSLFSHNCNIKKQDLTPFLPADSPPGQKFWFNPKKNLHINRFYSRIFYIQGQTPRDFLSCQITVDI